MSRLNRIGREIAAQTRLRRYLYHRYDYSFSPHQLGFLVDCLDRTSKVPGAVLEVGCAYGHTTVFLNKHLDTTGDQRRYVCIDTFRGFTSTDIAVEERDRGKTPASLAIIRRSYADASLRAFQRTMANNSVTRVTAVRADIESWKPDGLTGVSFCLIDVDLYRPVKTALEKIVPMVEPGGIVVVDDCQQHSLWDGAFEAYAEFAAREQLQLKIVEGQFGMIEIKG